MDELEPDFIKLLFITGFVFLLWVWAFWEDIQNSNEFHPDGLGQCPPETYTILDDVSTGVKCFSCPVCPAAEEPSPPCGITLNIKTTGECKPCRPGTYSDEIDSASCKVCSDCGPRKVISSCTSEKNTECKDCPWKHYEDPKTHTCKHCSICCGRSLPAERECIKSKKCKVRCIWSTKSKRRYFQKMGARSVNAPYNMTLKEDLITQQDDSKGNSSRVENFDTKTENLTSHRDKRDVNAQVLFRNSYEESTDSQTEKGFDENELEKLDFLEIPDIINYNHEQGDAPNTDRGKGPSSSPLVSTENNVNATNIHSPENKNHFSPQMSLGKDEVIVQPTEASSPIKGRSELSQLTPLNAVPSTSPTPSSQAQVKLNTTSFLSSFAGTIVAVLLLGIIGLIVYIVYKKCVPKILGYKMVGGTSKAKELQHQGGDNLRNYNINKDKKNVGHETANEIDNKATATTLLQDLNLAQIPPDLEDILVMSLDVPQDDMHSVPESKMYGWQRVGDAAGITRLELRYFEHLAKYESPTKILLDKLGSQGKTISYLLDVLQEPRVQLESVANTIIRHRGTRI